MAAIPHSPSTFYKSSASDLLQSSSNGVALKELGRARPGGARRRGFAVVAKMRKPKRQHEYPWPKDADENVKGGVLTHLSHFKPLKEKPKQVTLDFEKPLLDLQKKITEVRKMATETGLDFSDQIVSLENKYHQAIKDLYTHLTPIQRVSIARHPNRPTCLDHIFNITDKFVELHGDRAGYDDPAIVTGIGSINGRTYMFIGHQKGRFTKENIQRNFGMPTPAGYRKALRMMYYADHHGFPIVTFIDTPGAYADIKSEETGQGEAIAHNLRSMFGLKVPIVSIVIGEGGSGGALAIGCANKLLMLENAVFYVASPEACAAILWKTAKAAPKAAEVLKITAPDLCKLNICDGIIPEPLGGAHADPSWTSQQLKIVITETMDELLKMDAPKLLEHRHSKFRQLGGFEEGIPQDPIKKVNMKKKSEKAVTPKGEFSKTPDAELAEEIEKVKQNIQQARETLPKSPEQAKESLPKSPELDVDEMIEKLKWEVDMEYSAAVESMGMKDKLKALQEEFAKAKSSSAQLDPSLKDKIDKLSAEFEQGLSKAPNYASLKYRQDMLKELSKAKELSEKNAKVMALKMEINRRFGEVIKSKLEALKAEVGRDGSMNDSLDDELKKEKVLKTKKEIIEEMIRTLKSLNLNVEGVVPKLKDLVKLAASPELKTKNEKLNKEIQEVINNTINSTELKNKIEFLKLEAARSGKESDPDLKIKIAELTKQSLTDALNSSGLAEEYEKLRSEVIQAIESSNLNVGIVVPKLDDLIKLTALPELKTKNEELNKEIQEVMNNTINSTELKNKIESLKLESARSGKESDPDLKNKIAELIKQSLTDALNSSGLAEKYEKLRSEAAQAIEFLEGPNGSLKQECEESKANM